MCTRRILTMPPHSPNVGPGKIGWNQPGMSPYNSSARRDCYPVRAFHSGNTDGALRVGLGTVRSMAGPPLGPWPREAVGALR